MSYRCPLTVNYTDCRRLHPVLGEYGENGTKEVSIGYWNGELRLDIRKWDGGLIGKGISLTEDEVRVLRKILEDVDFGR